MEGEFEQIITKLLLSIKDNNLQILESYFYPIQNTVILLERYCGTITEPGLPVVNVQLGKEITLEVNNEHKTTIF